MGTGSWSYAAAGRQLFGRGVVERIGQVAASMAKRAFVCSDPVMASTGITQRVMRSLSGAGLSVTVFDGGSPEMDRAVVERSAAQAHEAAPDVIVGVGGGSNLDLAKLTALLISHGGSVRDYYGESRVPGPVVPLIAVPTTAGTGSEVTPVAVLGDVEYQLKVGVSSRHLVPRWAVIDPELSHTCPPGLTAHSGLDALAHAIEAFTARSIDIANQDLDVERVFVGKNPVSDALAVEAIGLIGSSLEAAYKDGQDAEARDRMMLGSVLAGMAFGVAGTTIAHALQYPIGARTKTPHGLGVALLLPATMRFNAEKRQDELATIGRLFDSSTMSDRDAAVRAVEHVEGMCHNTGIPSGLRDIGVHPDEFDEIADAALTIDRLVRNNARDVDHGALVAVLRDAWQRP